MTPCLLVIYCFRYIWEMSLPLSALSFAAIFQLFSCKCCPFYPQRPSPSGILFFDIYSKTWYNTTLQVWALVEMFCHLYLTALSVTLNCRLLKLAHSCHYCKQWADSPVLAMFNPVCTDEWVFELSADILTWCVEISAWRWDKTKNKTPNNELLTECLSTMKLVMDRLQLL